MIRVPTILVSAIRGLILGGLILGVGVAFAQQIEIVAAQDSIDQAIAHLQKAGEDQRADDPSLDARRTRAVRALAFLLLAKTELQGIDGVGRQLK